MYDTLAMINKTSKWEIPIESPFLGSDELRRADGQGMWEYFHSVGIPFRKEYFPFLTNHKIPRVKRIFDLGEYLHLSGKGEALAYLYSGLGKVWNYVGPVLDLELPHGFNDHTDRHTLWVTSTGIDLLSRAGRSYANHQGLYDSKSEVLMTLVGMCHDLGNLVDRKSHSMYSAWLLTRLFGNTEYHPEELRAVLYSILFHEEPMLADLAVDLGYGFPLQWALVAADKMHVGRDRIGDRSYASGIENHALEEDVHILLNAMVVRSSWTIEHGNFDWYLDLEIEQLEEKFASFTNGKGRIWLPETVFAQYKNGKSYSQIFSELFLRVYEARIRMVAMSVFLLYPYVENLRLYSSQARGESSLICRVER